MPDVIEPDVGVGEGQLRRERIPQRLFRLPDPKPTTAQMIEADPVLRGLREHGNLDDADLGWLASTGRAYTAIELPRFIEPAKPGRCLDVAAWLASSWGYDVVRGFAIHPDAPTPLPHAWGGEGQDAIDPSWREGKRSVSAALCG